MADQQKLQQAYMEYQMLEQHMKQLEQQQGMVRQQLTELTVSKDALQQLQSIKKGAEILVPISSGVYAQASLQDHDKLIVNIGADVAVTKTPSDAIAMLDTQTDELKKLQDAIKVEIEKYAQKAMELEKNLAQLSR